MIVCRWKIQRESDFADFTPYWRKKKEKNGTVRRIIRFPQFSIRNASREIERFLWSVTRQKVFYTCCRYTIMMLWRDTMSQEFPVAMRSCANPYIDVRIDLRPCNCNFHRADFLSQILNRARNLRCSRARISCSRRVIVMIEAFV